MSKNRSNDATTPASRARLARWTRDVVGGGVRDAFRELVKKATLFIALGIMAGTWAAFHFLSGEEVPAWLLPAGICWAISLAARLVAASRKPGSAVNSNWYVNTSRASACA